MAYQVMGLNKKEKEELKKLLKINSPVSSQKKRINFLKSRQKPSTKSKKPLDSKTSESQENIRKLRKTVRKRQLAKQKKPIVKPEVKSRNQTVIEKELARQKEMKADPKGYAAKRKAEALKRRKLREAKKQKQILSKSGKDMGKAIGKGIKQRQGKKSIDQEGGVGQGLPLENKKRVAKTTNKTTSKNKKVDQSSYTKPQPSTAGRNAKDTESPLALLTKVKKKTIDQEGGVGQGLPLKVKKKKQTASGRRKQVETADKANKRIRLSKARPTNKPPKKAIVSKRTQQEKDAGAGKFTGGGRTQQEKDAGAGKFTAKKSTKKSTSLPPLLNNSIAKEIIKSHGGEPAFKDKTNISSKIGRALGDKSNATQKMNNVVYNKLADEYNNDSGQMSEARKNLYFKMKNAKSGGQVRKRKGGMIKRNMGGPAKPRKKTVFRRGGGKALRGFGNATYSNKLY